MRSSETRSPFSDAETAALRAHGIVLHAGRVIFDAQPPLSEHLMQEVERRCVGPLPEDLRALWRVTAGGQLDYDLTVSMRGQQEVVSWVELFYPESPGYHDLLGWIEHEADLIAEVRAEGSSGSLRAWWRDRRRPRLTHLPIGGFSYGDRIYVQVEPGPRNGEVVAWKEGLPSAGFLLQEDAVAPVASSLTDAFASLCLEQDPLDPVESYFSGQALFEHLDEREEHGLDRGLRDKLVSFYRQARLDWATSLAAGTLAGKRDLAAAALRQAVSTDDADLVERLAEARVPLDAPLRGSAVPLEVAIQSDRHKAAAALVRAGAAIPSDVLRLVRGPVPTELVSELLRRGARPEIEAVLTCVAWGAADAAAMLVRAGPAHGIDVARLWGPARDASTSELEAELARVLDPSARFHHFLGAHGLEEQLARLRDFDPERS